jgi:hypothetical protein
MCFDSAASRAEHHGMDRLDHTRTVVSALVRLADTGPDRTGLDRTGRDRVVLSRKVDAMVDAYLVSFSSSARQTAAMRKILADEFLAAAPFTELSYRIWRRIMCEDTDVPEPPLRVTSGLLLPELDFPPPAAFIAQRAVAPPRAATKARRSFFGRR